MRFHMHLTVTPTDRPVLMKDTEPPECFDEPDNWITMQVADDISLHGELDVVEAWVGNLQALVLEARHG